MTGEKKPRAKKGSAECLTRVLSFRVTDEEYALLQRHRRGYDSIQEYLRDVVVTHVASR